MGQNPKLYRQLSEPFPTREAADAAVAAFAAEVEALREKHRIADVHVLCAAPIPHPDGGEASLTTSHHMGDPLLAPQMLAHALGKEQARQEATLSRLARGKA